MFNVGARLVVEKDEKLVLVVQSSSSSREQREHHNVACVMYPLRDRRTDTIQFLTYAQSTRQSRQVADDDRKGIQINW